MDLVWLDSPQETVVNSSLSDLDFTQDHRGVKKRKPVHSFTLQGSMVIIFFFFCFKSFDGHLREVTYILMTPPPSPFYEGTLSKLGRM